MSFFEACYALKMLMNLNKGHLYVAFVISTSYLLFADRGIKQACIFYNVSHIADLAVFFIYLLLTGDNFYMLSQ